MQNTADRLICLFTMPSRFFKEVELNGIEGSLLAMASVFLHMLILLLLGVGTVKGLFIIPPLVIIMLLIFSFFTFFVLKFFKPCISYSIIYNVSAYAYFMMSAIHLALYIIIWIPGNNGLLALLLIFGGLFFAVYLTITALTFRLGMKPVEVCIGLGVSFFLCFLIGHGTGSNKINELIEWLILSKR